MSRSERDLDLREAIAATGQAVMALPHDHRHEAVTRVLAAHGWLPQDQDARWFLISVFVAAHEQRGNLGAFSRVLDLISQQEALLDGVDAGGDTGDRPVLDRTAIAALREAMDQG